MKEEKEFRLLYQSSKAYCLRVLQKWTTNASDAEDIFAEALSIYWVRQKQGKLKNDSNIPAYICTIAVNLFKKRAKASSKMVGLDQTYETLPWVEPDDESPSPRVLLLRRAFKKLGEDCQKLLTAKYVYGYKYEEMAEEMGRSSAGSLKVQTFRCTKYLYKLMQEVSQSPT